MIKSCLFFKTKIVAEEEAEKEAEIKKEKKILDKEVVKVKKETKETAPPAGMIQ